MTNSDSSFPPAEIDRPIWESQAPCFVPWATGLRKPLRVKLFIMGIVFPTICLLNIWTGARPSIDQLWQSGDTSTYLVLLLSYPAFFMFLPIIGYSMICLAIWCWNPDSSVYFAIRLGLYTGFLIAGVSSFALIPLTIFVVPMSALGLLIVLEVGMWLALKTGPVLAKFRRFSILEILYATTVIALVLVFFRMFPNLLGDVVAAPFIILFIIVGGAAPLASFAFYRAVHTAKFIASFGEPSLKRTVLGGCVAWLATAMLNWKMATDVMMDEYLKLPPQSPNNCFVCSAAAHGHPQFVGATLHSGIPLNRQMQRLKLLEFALQVLTPRLHRNIRRIYNRIGPPVAKLCRLNRWTADAVYLVLKPLEYISIGLQKQLSVSNEQLSQVYRPADQRAKFD